MMPNIWYADGGNGGSVRTAAGVPAVQELYRGVAQVTCAIGNVVICLSEQTPDQSYLHGYAHAINDYASRNYPTGLGLLVLIAEDEPPPDDQARRAIHTSHIAIKGCMRVGVLVVEGEGFVASAKRSVIAMLSFSPSAAFPTKVAGNISEGATKLAKLLGPHLDPKLNAEIIATAAAQVRKGFR